MKVFFLNAVNLSTGGGKSILRNLLLSTTEDKNVRYEVLVPDHGEYATYASEHVHVFDLPKSLKKKFLFPVVNHFFIPLLIRRSGANAVFTLGNIATPTEVPQLLMLHWPYAVYPNSPVWNRMGTKSRWIRKVRRFLFGWYLQYANTVTVQTQTMRSRLKKYYGRESVVIPSPVSLMGNGDQEGRDFHLPEGRKLLFLTHYYPHKNLEVFLPLAQIIKDRELDYKLVITIDPQQHRSAGELLNRIADRHLQDVVVNVGQVDMEDVPSLYRQCDAFLMPTFLESYGLTYFEAMHQGLPILTSDLDFARDVCRNAAYYFDPMDASSVFASMERVFADEEERKGKISRGQDILASLPDWNTVLEEYKTELLKVEKKTISMH